MKALIITLALVFGAQVAFAADHVFASGDLETVELGDVYGAGNTVYINGVAHRLGVKKSKPSSSDNLEVVLDEVGTGKRYQLGGKLWSTPKLVMVAGELHLVAAGEGRKVYHRTLTTGWESLGGKVQLGKDGEESLFVRRISKKKTLEITIYTFGNKYQSRTLKSGWSDVK